MSISGLWDSLANLMAHAALLVDCVRALLLWACLLLVPIYLLGLVVWALDHLAGNDGGVGADSPHRPIGFHDRLDRMADVIISRRPQTRKRRHRHHHQAGADHAD